MIVSFGDDATEDLFHGRKTKRVTKFPSNIISVSLRKLDMINSAHSLMDLSRPLGNRLEALKGALKGYQSIRVNDQWRIIFVWEQGNAHSVQLTDYH